jgi:hypothetical protein
MEEVQFYLQDLRIIVEPLEMFKTLGEFLLYYFTVEIFVFASPRALTEVVSFFLIFPVSHVSVLISASFHSGHIGAKRNLLFSLDLNDKIRS